MHYLVVLVLCSMSVDGATFTQSPTQLVMKHIKERFPMSKRNQNEKILNLFPLTNRGGAIQKVNDQKHIKFSLSPLAFASIFAFLGGWSHSLCNKKFDAYTAMVSGHIINMSISLAKKQWNETLFRLSIVGSYFCGVMSGSFIEVRCERSKTEKIKANNHHFKVIAGLVVAIFAVAEKVKKIQINLLAFGYGLIYPSLSAMLGGTITHLLTGHTTNVARLIGANQMHQKSMKMSLCILGSVIFGSVFGTIAMIVLGEEFPFFTMLGFLYAAFLLLL